MECSGRRFVDRRATAVELATEQPLLRSIVASGISCDPLAHNFGQNGNGRPLRWNNRPAPLYARVNRLKISPEQICLHSSSRQPICCPNASNFIVMAIPLTRRRLASGDCYIQDPSTVMACDLLDPKPGDKILDACAAPGGKTGYLAEKMANHGALLACDRDRGRIERLRGNLSRLDIQIAQVVEHDWTKPSIPAAIRSSARFDRILVDAPCSNTGVMRRRVDVRWRLRLTDFRSMQQQQLAILKNVTRLLKPDGVLVYSTCSIEPEENEQVARQISKTAGLRADPETQLLPFRDHFDGAFAARFVKPR